MGADPAGAAGRPGSAHLLFAAGNVLALPPAMSSSESKPQRAFDVRTIERNIKKGNITRKDYEKYLKALPDAADKVAPPEEDDLEDDVDDDSTDEQA